jgi:maleylacetate reductase
VHEVVQHVPEALAESAGMLARDTQADGVLTIGGGSATGLGKAVAVATGLPLVAVPTTYAGSEMTAVYGVTGTHKVTGRDPRALPKAVLFDPRLTLAMPPATTATSGLNALAHCVEAVYAPHRSPLTTLAAEAGARALASSLRRVVPVPDDLAARADALYGALLAGWVMNIAGTSVHHRICHVIGGTFRLPHAEVHAVLLPHVVALVEPAIPERLRGIAGSLGSERATGGVAALGRDLGAPTSLRSLGMPEDGLDAAADLAAAAVVDDSPVPLDAEVLAGLLRDAYAGRTPGAHRA